PAPPDKAQRNVTDPESRIMKGPDGLGQAYNAQLGVDAGSHVIVAQLVTNAGTDSAQFDPLLAQVKGNTGRQAAEVSADAGYCSEANLQAADRRHVRAYIATGRQRHGTASATGPGWGLHPRASCQSELRKAFRLPLVGRTPSSGAGRCPGGRCRSSAPDRAAGCCAAGYHPVPAAPRWPWRPGSARSPSDRRRPT